MSIPPKPGRFTLFWILPIFLASFFFGFIFSSFSFTDRFVSNFFSQQLTMNVEMHQVRWKPLFGINFGNVRVTDTGKKEWMRCQKGTLQYQGWLGNSQEVVSLSGVLFSSENFFQPLLIPNPEQKLEGKGFYFPQVKIFLNGSHSARYLRILKMKSSLLEFKGSSRWMNGTLDKASFWVLMSAGWIQKLPARIERRLSRTSGDQKILKCAYSRRHLSFYGRSGPLLRAVWNT